MGLFVFQTWACKSLETVRKGFIRFPKTPLLEVRPGNLSLRKVVGGCSSVKYWQRRLLLGGAMS